MLPKPIRATAAEIVRLFHYDPNTGVLVYRHTGLEAGFWHEGRRMVGIKKQYIQVTRVIWVYCHGYVPLVPIDHEDGDKTNNRRINLRLCVKGGVNEHNQRKAHSNNRTGWLGVRKRSNPKRKKKFHASIRLAGKSVSLGDYHTPEEASAAYVQAKRKLHKFGTL